jgi:hypothetical protein
VQSNAAQVGPNVSIKVGTPTYTYLIPTNQTIGMRTLVRADVRHVTMRARKGSTGTLNGVCANAGHLTVRTS